MPLSTTPVTGTIRIEPRPPADGCGHATSDDSTLQLVLETFAHCESLAAEPAREAAPVRWLASGRLRRTRLADDGMPVAICANLGQLLADLQVEYDQLALPG